MTPPRRSETGAAEMRKNDCLQTPEWVLPTLRCDGLVQRLAWEVEIDASSCVVFAPTKPKARWLAVKAYWDAFGRSRAWPHTSIARRPIYDRFPHLNQNRAFTPDYVRSLC